MFEIICAIICGALSLIFLIISIMSFMKRGFLFNNAYIWASKQERESMDKKPYYRQSAIVFALFAAVFLFMALDCYFLTDQTVHQGGFTHIGSADQCHKTGLKRWILVHIYSTSFFFLFLLITRSVINKATPRISTHITI